MSANTLGKITGYGSINQKTFDYSDNATAQQWIIISEDELEAYRQIAIATDIESVTADENGYNSPSIAGIYTPGGMRLQKVQQGVNIIKYKDGSSKKIFVE